jgi:hypothetical protein
MAVGGVITQKIGYDLESLGEITPPHILHEAEAIPRLRLALITKPGAFAVLVIEPEAIFPATRWTRAMLLGSSRKGHAKACQDFPPPSVGLFSKRSGFKARGGHHVVVLSVRDSSS